MAGIPITGVNIRLPSDSVRMAIIIPPRFAEYPKDVKQHNSKTSPLNGEVLLLDKVFTV